MVESGCIREDFFNPEELACPVLGNAILDGTAAEGAGEEAVCYRK